MPRSRVPKGMERYVDDWQMSPGLADDGFIFMTGFTGASPDGACSKHAAEQIETVFSKIACRACRG